MGSIAEVAGRYYREGDILDLSLARNLVGQLVKLKDTLLPEDVQKISPPAIIESVEARYQSDTKDGMVQILWFSNYATWDVISENGRRQAIYHFSSGAISEGIAGLSSGTGVLSTSIGATESKEVAHEEYLKSISKFPTFIESLSSDPIRTMMKPTHHG